RIMLPSPPVLRDVAGERRFFFDKIFLADADDAGRIGHVHRIPGIEGPAAGEGVDFGNGCDDARITDIEHAGHAVHVDRSDNGRHESHTLSTIYSGWYARLCMGVHPSCKGGGP